ncbi:hypothetical protein JCM8097_002027 [Rhodosporidiobolus ruineniae]
MVRASTSTTATAQLAAQLAPPAVRSFLLLLVLGSLQLTTLTSNWVHPLSNGSLDVQWRQFSFFSSAPFPSSSSSSSPPLVANPALISSLHANPTLGDGGLVLLADLDGRVHLVNERWEPDRSWTAYDGGRVQWIETTTWDSRKGRCIVVTVGDDRSTPFPLLKVWLLTLSLPSPAAATTSTSTSLPPLPSEAHLTLLRSTPINPTPSRPTPVSALALAPTLSHLVVGLADGSVVAWKRADELIEQSLNDLEDAALAASAAATGAKPRPFVPGGLGKLRVLWEGNKEPVTSVGITSPTHSSPSPAALPAGLQTLYILTTSQILALPLPVAHSPAASVGKYKHAKPAVLDEHGAAVGCAKVLRLSVPGEGDALGDGGETTAAVRERLVVAREEAVYVYGAEGREGCWAYEGPKASIVPLYTSASPSPSSSALPTPYLAILTPPQRSTLASTSATIRAHASSRSSASPSTASPAPGGPEERVGKVTVFDPENKFVAFSAPFGESVGGTEGEAGVREVVEAWGAVWVLTESGKLFRLIEQPLANSLQQLYQRNLYTLAISFAQSRGLSGSEVAEIYKRYGDHLYGKADYEGAMGCYLKTVGVVQASYVIRKFLDAQRLTHLTSYLQELHSRNLANSDLTTLLLNCYTKLGDSAALEAFIHSSSSSSPSPNAEGEGEGEPPFDLETAIRVLRQASYFHHAAWLAQRYKLHGEVLRIRVEDEGDYAGALGYVRELVAGQGQDEKEREKRDEAREAMRRYGGLLLAKEPEETTKVLVEVCCGPERAVTRKEEPATNGAAKGKKRATAGGAGGYDVPDSASVSGSPARSTTASFTAEPADLAEEDDPAQDLPSPRIFFPHFVDHPAEFVEFLEAVVARRYGRPVSSFARSSSSSTIGPAPLPEVRVFGEEDDLDAAEGLFEDGKKRDEQVVFNTLLELYISPFPAPSPSPSSTVTSPLAAHAAAEARRRTKALALLKAEGVPLDRTQALVVCATRGFEEGFVWLYECEGRYEEVVRYYIDASLADPSSTTYSTRLISSLRRYGPSSPSLYPLVLRHLTSTAALLSRHQPDVLDLLDEIDAMSPPPMTPIEVVRCLSEGGVAGLVVVSGYLKKQLTREKEEIDSDLALLSSYRSETAKKVTAIRELSDPNEPAVFQVTRCTACGGTLEAPMVHFMCKHSYHQRCLGESESTCPTCAASHGVIRELRRSSAQLAGRHDLFLDEVRESEDGFKAVAGAFGRGVMEIGKA